MIRRARGVDVLGSRRWKSEECIHGVFDRCRGEPPDEFETVDGFEPVDQPFFEIESKGFIMSPGTITQSYDRGQLRSHLFEMPEMTNRRG